MKPEYFINSAIGLIVGTALSYVAYQLGLHMVAKCIFIAGWIIGFPVVLLAAYAPWVGLVFFLGFIGNLIEARP